MSKPANENNMTGGVRGKPKKKTNIPPKNSIVEKVANFRRSDYINWNKLQIEAAQARKKGKNVYFPYINPKGSKRIQAQIKNTIQNFLQTISDDQARAKRSFQTSPITQVMRTALFQRPETPINITINNLIKNILTMFVLGEIDDTLHDKVYSRLLIGNVSPVFLQNYHQRFVKKLLTNAFYLLIQNYDSANTWLSLKLIHYKTLFGIYSGNTYQELSALTYADLYEQASTHTPAAWEDTLLCIALRGCGHVIETNSVLINQKLAEIRFYADNVSYPQSPIKTNFVNRRLNPPTHIVNQGTMCDGGSDVTIGSTFYRPFLTCSLASPELVIEIINRAENQVDTISPNIMFRYRINGGAEINNDLTLKRNHNSDIYANESPIILGLISKHNLSENDIYNYTFKLNKKWGLDYSQFMLLLNFPRPIARLTGDIHDFVMACLSMKLFFNQPGENQPGENIRNFLICQSTQAYYNNATNQIHIVGRSGSLNDIMADQRYMTVGGKRLHVGGEKKLTASDYESVFFILAFLINSNKTFYKNCLEKNPNNPGLKKIKVSKWNGNRSHIFGLEKETNDDFLTKILSINYDTFSYIENLINFKKKTNEQKINIYAEIKKIVGIDKFEKEEEEVEDVEVEVEDVEDVEDVEVEDVEVEDDVEETYKQVKNFKDIKIREENKDEVLDFDVIADGDSDIEIIDKIHIKMLKYLSYSEKNDKTQRKIDYISNKSVVEMLAKHDLELEKQKEAAESIKAKTPSMIDASNKSESDANKTTAEQSFLPPLPPSNNSKTTEAPTKITLPPLPPSNNSKTAEQSFLPPLPPSINEESKKIKLLTPFYTNDESSIKPIFEIKNPNSGNTSIIDQLKEQINKLSNSIKKTNNEGSFMLIDSEGDKKNIESMKFEDLQKTNLIEYIPKSVEKSNSSFSFLKSGVNSSNNNYKQIQEEMNAYNTNFMPVPPAKGGKRKTRRNKPKKTRKRIQKRSKKFQKKSRKA